MAKNHIKKENSKWDTDTCYVWHIILRTYICSNVNKKTLWYIVLSFALCNEKQKWRMVT